MIYDLLKKLIENKYYEEKEEITRKLDVFYAMSKITEEQFSELTLLVESKYAPIEEIVDESYIEL